MINLNYKNRGAGGGVQVISITDGTITLSDGGGSVTLPVAEFQTLSLNGDILTLSDGGQVDLSSVIGGSGGSATGEDKSIPQDLSLDGNQLGITDGMGVDLSEFKQTLSFGGGNLIISGGNSIPLPGQNITLDGRTLTLSLGGGAVTLPVQSITYVDGLLSLSDGGGSIDLSSLENDPAQTLSLTGNTLSLSGGGGEVVLPEGSVQTLTLVGNTLSLSNGGGSVTLPNADGDTPQVVSIVGNRLSLSGGGGEVDLPEYPAQTITISGRTITLSENGGEITLPDDNTPQSIVLVGNTLSLSDGGGSVTLPEYPAQTISINGRTIALSEGGGEVVVPQDAPQIISIDGDIINLSGGGGSITLPQSDGTVGDPQTLSISGNVLSISEGNSVTIPSTGGGGNGFSTNVTHEDIAAATTHLYINNPVTLTAPITTDSNVEFGPLGYLTLNGHKLVINGSVIAHPENYIFRDTNILTTLGKKFAHVGWFGVKNDATHDSELTCTNRSTATKSYHSFRRAKLAVGQYGTLVFAGGAYYMADETQDWLNANTVEDYRAVRFCIQYHERHGNGTYDISHGLHIILQRDTVLLPAGDGSSEYGSIEGAPYRDGGWRDYVDEVITYVDNLSYGSRSVTSRVAGAFADYESGTIAYLNGGAAGGFDQHFGQFIEIDRRVGDTVYFKQPLEKDLRTEYSSSGATVTSGFNAPADGALVTFTIDLDSSGSNKVPGQNDRDGLFSVGNDLYQYVSWAETSPKLGDITARKLAGHGNVTQDTPIPAGTKLFRKRCFILTPATVKDARLSANGARVGGWRNGQRGSNTFNFHISDLVEYWKPLPADPNNGLHYDSDGGYGWLQEGGETISVGNRPANAQWARSATRGVHRGRVFNNAYWDASEFSTSITLENCKFYLDFREFRHQKPAIIIDETCSGVVVNNVEVFTQGTNEIFKGSGVGTFSHSAGGGARINKVRVQVEDGRTLFGGPITGYVSARDIDVRGNLRSLFSGTSTRDTPGYGDKLGRFTVGGGTVVRGLFFQGKLDVFTSSPLTSGDIEAEVVFMGYNTPGGDAGGRARGTIIRRNEDASPLDLSDLRLRLTLWNWPYLDGGMIGSNLNWGNTGSALIRFMHTDRGNGPENFYEAYGNVKIPTP